MTHNLNGELWLPSDTLGIPNVRIIGTHVDGDRDLIIDVESSDVSTLCLTTIILPLQNKLVDHDALLSAHIDLRQLREFVVDHPFRKTGTIGLIDAEGNEILTQSEVRYRLPPIEVKGKVQPIQIYEAVYETADRLSPEVTKP